MPDRTGSLSWLLPGEHLFVLGRSSRSTELELPVHSKGRWRKLVWESTVE